MLKADDRCLIFCNAELCIVCASLTRVFCLFDSFNQCKRCYVFESKCRKRETVLYPLHYYSNSVVLFLFYSDGIPPLHLLKAYRRLNICIVAVNVIITWQQSDLKHNFDTYTSRTHSNIRHFHSYVNLFCQQQGQFSKLPFS